MKQPAEERGQKMVRREGKAIELGFE